MSFLSLHNPTPLHSTWYLKTEMGLNKGHHTSMETMMWCGDEETGILALILFLAGAAVRVPRMGPGFLGDKESNTKLQIQF